MSEQSDPAGIAIEKKKEKRRKHRQYLQQMCYALLVASIRAIDGQAKWRQSFAICLPSWTLQSRPGASSSSVAMSSIKKMP